MDTVDVDVLEVESYKSPEPEEYAGSTQGPQFSDLFSVPTPPPVYTAEQPSLLSTDEPDKNKQNGQPPETFSTQQAETDITKNGESLASDVIPTDLKNTEQNDAKENVVMVNAESTQNGSVIINNNKQQEDEFDFDVTPITNPSISSPEKPQTLPLSNNDNINQAETVDNTNNTTAATMRMESIDFEMCSPSEAPQNKSIDLHMERQVSSGSMPKTGEVQTITGGAPNFSSLLTENKANTVAQEDDEFDFEVEAKPVVCKPKQMDVSSEKPTMNVEIQQQDHKTQPEVDNVISPIPQTVETKVAIQSSVLQEPVVSSDLSQAQDAWEAVQTITPEVQGEGAITGGKKAVESSPVISYIEAHQHSIESDLKQYKGQIKTSVHRSGFKAFKHALFGPSKLHRDLVTDRDNAFCLALYSFSNEDPVHVRILQTIYKRLTGSKFDCPRFGSHWEQIGFQGNDPSTDLRGCGMLGLLQLLYMLTTPKYLSMARDIYKLSLHETQNFPFCVMGINITRIAIQALREDCLNKECNKSHGEGLMKVLNDFYTATYYHLYTIWKTQHKTIAQTGFVIKDVETHAKKSPGHVLHELERHIKQQKQTNPSSNTDDLAAQPPINFSKFSEE